MAGERLQRRLTAILAADVAGYSRLTGEDEEGTHVRLQDHYLRSLREPLRMLSADSRGEVILPAHFVPFAASGFHTFFAPAWSRV